MATAVPWVISGSSSDPCCCGPEVCEATLECDRVSATGTKKEPPACAFFEEETGKWWLKRTLITDYNREIHQEFEASDGSWFTTIDQTSAGTTTRIEECDEETGELTVTCSQSRSGSGTATTTYPDEPEYNCTNGYTLTCSTNPENNCDFNEYDCEQIFTSDPEGCSATEFPLGGIVAGSAVPRAPVYENEWVPETTEELIDRVTGELPGWEESTGGCGASRNLSEDESSFSLAKGRWRVVHPRPSTGAIEVILVRTTTPEGGSPSTSFLSYTWSGDPEGGEITGPWNPIDTPSSDGAVSVAIVSINCEIDG